MIDLHCHSLFSDGDQMPNDLLRKAHSLASFSDKDYVFHSKFGYGVVLGEEKDLLKIKFDSHFEIKYVIIQ